MKASDFCWLKEKWKPNGDKPIEVWLKSATRNVVDFLKKGGNLAAIFSNMFDKCLPKTFAKAMFTKYGDRNQDNALVQTYLAEGEQMYKVATSKS